MDSAVRPRPGEGRKLPKPNNIVTVPPTSSLDFFKWWCIFLRPFLPLTDKEVEVVACFLKHRWEMSKHITDPALLDEMVMSESVVAKVMEECNITKSYYYVLRGNLKKNKVIVNGSLNPRLIPNIREDDKGYFQLLILFKGGLGK